MSDLLAINTIYFCIQGEGSLTGVPMILLRLQGCGVGCPFCDTRETWVVRSDAYTDDLDNALSHPAKWTRLSPSQIAYELRQRFPRSVDWVLVTGGEPAEQELSGLVYALHDAGYNVALETSGTAIGHLDAPFDWVCVSPKVGMPGGKPVLPKVLEKAHELKFVIGRQSDLAVMEDLLTQCTLPADTTICLQPMSQAPRATAMCVATCLEKGYRLSVQVHKYIDLP